VFKSEAGVGAYTDACADLLGWSQSETSNLNTLEASNENSYAEPL